MMRLASIINSWVDSIEFLRHVIDNHLKFCDNVIVVWSTLSNHGNSDEGKMMRFIEMFPNDVPVTFLGTDPSFKQSALVNETRKRNSGIEEAKRQGFTHFIMADTDEFYEPELMIEEKKRFNDPALNGLVHRLKVYIKSPTLYTYDHTLCCGIHKLNNNTYAGNFKEYPFAYDDQDKAHIDPSRRLSFTSGIEMSEAYMHHFSYVRKDINLKIDNSSANLRKSKQVIHDELRDAKPGYVSRLYHQPLQESENIFNIVI